MQVGTLAQLSKPLSIRDRDGFPLPFVVVGQREEWSDSMGRTLTKLDYHVVFSTKSRVHLALGIPPTLAVSRALQLLKGGSSRWIGESFPKLRKFAWQDGYGAFSVSKSILPSVENYILQRQHHQKQTFQDEFRELLTKHGIAYADKYLWD